MSPLYETQADRDRENGVASFIGGLLKLDIHNTSTESPIDFELRREGNLHAIMEIKCRDIKWGTYEDFRVDKAKVDKVLRFSEDHYCTGLIVVRCNDKIGIANAQNFIHNSTDGIISRTDRNDRFDTDRSYCMPWSKFNRVVATPAHLQRFK